MLSHNTLFLNIEDAHVIKYRDNYTYISSNEFDSELFYYEWGYKTPQQIFWQCIHDDFFRQVQYKKYSAIYLKTSPIKEFTYE